MGLRTAVVEMVAWWMKIVVFLRVITVSALLEVPVNDYTF